MDTIQHRIKEAMGIRNIKQSELVNKTGISKGALSSYINGKYLPKQFNIYKISNALKVDPAWLLGFDVPMDRAYNTDSDCLITKYSQLSERDKAIVSNMIDSMIEDKK